MWSPDRQSGTSKIFGPAYMVQMVDAKDTIAPKPPMHFADGIKKDSVVFISQPKNMYSACWGGLMSTRAKYLGAQGVIIDGKFRDVNEHRDLSFPVSLQVSHKFPQLKCNDSCSQKVHQLLAQLRLPDLRR